MYVLLYRRMTYRVFALLVKPWSKPSTRQVSQFIASREPKQGLKLAPVLTVPHKVLAKAQQAAMIPSRVSTKKCKGTIPTVETGRLQGIAVGKPCPYGFVA